MKIPQIAAQLYTIRDFTKTPDDLDKSMKKIKDIGYNAVQVSGVGPMEDQAIKDIMDKYDLTVCATHIGFDIMQGDLDKVISQHKLWGCSYVGLGSMPNNYRGSREGFVSFAKEASKIAQKLSDAGLNFIYHNHNFEFRRFDGTLGMDILLTESDPETFGFEIDTYWIQVGGANPIDWINKVGQRMKVVHYKDLAIDQDDKQAMAEVGEGNLDWPGIIAASRKNKIEWAAVEQDICPGDPFESLKISFDNLIKLGLEA